jgi:para-nitrobenzyl esterase
MAAKLPMLIVSLAFAAGVSPAAAKQSPAGPIIETSDGKIRGVQDDGVYAFRGIPYAAAPVGDRRWAPPAPVRKWRGVRDARKFGAACIQKPGLSGANGGDPGPLSEDCLTVNVWTPVLDPSAKLPVIVWIHGGAFVFGGSGLAGYSGAPTAKKNAVFVSLNYRLGALGFFAHPALAGENGGAMNFGLLDQVAALKWVRDNIAEFGGDPGNVTIMGQSAGAKSVMAHYASPLSRGLFAKGVAMSAYILPDATKENARAVAGAVASAVGLDGEDAKLKDLRRIPAKRFAEINDKAASQGPVPIVGDEALPRSIAETFEAKAEAPEPLIMGNTSDDASVIAAFGLDPAAIIKKLGAAGLGLKILYPNLSEDERARQALRDVVFTMNARWVADRRSSRAPTWRYYFDYVAENDRKALPNGAPHGYDVAFLLDTVPFAAGLDGRYTKGDAAYARAASSYFAEFARSGAPSSDGAPAWPSDGGLRDAALVFGRETIELDRNFMRLRLNTLIGATRLVGGALSR